MLVEDDYDQDDITKYEEINKILKEVDMSYLAWSKEDNKIKSRFLHLVDQFEIKKMDIPSNIAYYKGLLQKV